IVWAANAHIMRYTPKMLDQIGSKLGRKAPNFIFRNMGTDFTQYRKLERQTYILGFTSGTGRAGRLDQKTFKIYKRKNSFEGWIDTSYSYGFIDFVPFNISHPNYHKRFQLKGFTHMYYPKEFAWNKAFDGIFY